VLTDLTTETVDKPIRSRVSVTTEDIAHYRDSHPNTKARNRPGMRRSA
jgi:hypothetical protein